jgi:hypothetical protein
MENSHNGEPAAGSATPPAGSAPPGPTRLERLFQGRWGLVILYAFFLAAYLGASGPRLERHSPYNHFVFLAEGWLEGRLALRGQPPNENDWARVDELELHDGRTVRGKFGSAGAADRFYFTRGGSETIDESEIRSRTAVRYVSFPPFPAVPMVPFVALAGMRFNDVAFTAVWAAFNPVLMFLLLRHLVRRGYSRRSVADDLWLVALLGVGSVYYYSSVIGQVWYTAHVIAVTIVILYTSASVEAARPWLAGTMLGLGFATRTPLGFMFPLFLWEAVRMSGGWRSLWQSLRRDRRLPARLFGKLWKCVVPAAALLLLLFAYNHARFDRFTVFGHEYLNISWKERLERWGLFNYHFLSRNLACALVLLPKILAAHPWVQYSRHGMSLFVTSPNLAWLFGRREPSPLGPGLWIAILAVALPSLLYQNSGYQQFGYRFSNDYIVYLLVLLAVGGQRFGLLFKALVVLAAGINLFGAVTFDRFQQFSYEDNCIFPHGCN